jgi:lipoate-protein ligase A
MEKKEWRLLDLGIGSDFNWLIGLTNVVASHIKRGRVPSTVIVGSNSGFRITMGIHEDIDSVVNLQKAREYGVDVARRYEGGGTIWIPPHPGMGIALKYVLDRKEVSIGEAMNLYIKVAEETAKELGMRDISVVGSGDIRFEGVKKVGSSTLDLIEDCYSLNDGFFVYKASEMRFDIYLEVAKIPAAKFKDKAIKEITQYLAGICDTAGREVPYDEVRQAYAKNVERFAGIKLVAGELTPEERKEIEESIRIQRTEPWLLRKSSSSFKAKNEGYKIGSAEEKYKKLVQFNVAVNPETKELRDVMISGDIYVSPLETVADMEEALKGADATNDEELLNRIKNILSKPGVEVADLHRIEPEEYLSVLKKAIEVALQS